MKPANSPSDEATSTEQMISHLEEYLRTSIELAGVEVAVRAIRAISSGLHAALACGLLVLFLLFSSVGLSWWIGELLNNIKLGFLVMGGIYFVLLAIMVLFRSTLLNFLRKTLTHIWYG